MGKSRLGYRYNTAHIMGSEMIEDFRSYRSRMNKRIMAQGNKLMRRIYNLDTNAYLEGAIVIPHTRRALEYWEELES